MPAPRMSPTMNSSRSVGPITRLSSGSSSMCGCSIVVVDIHASQGPSFGQWWPTSQLAASIADAEMQRGDCQRPGSATVHARSAEEDLCLGVLLRLHQLELPGPLGER